MRTLVFICCLAIVSSVMAAQHTSIGITDKGTRIEALIIPGASVSSPTVAMICGMQGEDESTRSVRQEAKYFEDLKQPQRPFRLIAIPLANPDRSRLDFPPKGVAYRDNPESHVLWRWMAIHSVDLALIAGADDSGLAHAFSDSSVAGVGRSPAETVPVGPGILRALSMRKKIAPSEAHLEIQRRRLRSPQQLAAELARYYGHEFNDLTYIPGMGLIGQMRLGNIGEVENLVQPWFDGPKADHPTGLSRKISRDIWSSLNWRTAQANRFTRRWSAPRQASGLRRQGK